MSTDTREERLARRIADLYANDQQFADARPSAAITAAIDQPGLRLPQIVRTVMEGYADRPALGQRAVRFVTDPRDRPHLTRAAAAVRDHQLPRAVGPRRRGRDRPGRRASRCGPAIASVCWASPASTTRLSTWRWS